MRSPDVMTAGKKGVALVMFFILLFLLVVVVFLSHYGSH